MRPLGACDKAQQPHCCCCCCCRCCLGTAETGTRRFPVCRRTNNAAFCGEEHMGLEKERQREREGMRQRMIERGRQREIQREAQRTIDRETDTGKRKKRQERRHIARQTDEETPRLEGKGASHRATTRKTTSSEKETPREKDRSPTICCWLRNRRGPSAGRDKRDRSLCHPMTEAPRKKTEGESVEGL